MPATALQRRFATLAVTGTLWLGVSLASLPLLAAVFAGKPILERIGPHEYRATPLLWSLTTAPGRLYVGSADGLLSYDGVAWTLLPLPGGVDATVVRRLPDGTVMVGGHDTWGRLDHDPVNGYHHVDLLAASGLDAEARKLGVVWEIAQTGEGVLVHSERFLQLLPADGGPLQVWPTPPAMRSLLVSGGEVFARFEGKGLGRLRQGEWQPLPGGERFAETAVAAVLAWGGNRYVVAADGVWRIERGGFRRALAWPRPELPVYVVAPLEGGGFVLGTADGELLHVDAGLRLRQVFKASEQMVVDLRHDPEGRLWVATETEVLRVDLPSRWSLLGGYEGLHGLVTDSAEFDGALWVAGGRGLQRLTADGRGGVRTERLPWVSLEAYALLADERGLLVAERQGLWLLRRGETRPQRLHGGSGVTHLLPARGDPDRVWAVAETHVLDLQHGPEGWRIARRWPLDGMVPQQVLELLPGELWFSDDRGAPQRWRIDDEGRLDRQVFGPERGLPQNGPNRPRLFAIDGEVMAWADGQLHRLDPAGTGFAVTEPAAWMRELHQPERLEIVETAMGLFAVSPRDLLLRRKDSRDWERVQFGGAASSGFGMPRLGASGVLRVPAWNGLLQYNPEGPLPTLQPLAVAFDRLQTRWQDGDWQPAQPEHGVLRLRSGEALRLRFGLQTLEAGATYRYRLSGVVDAFTEWADRDLAIRGLSPGEYDFEVEGRLPSGRPVAPMRLRLLVEPSWYQHPLLRLAALTLLLLGSAWAVRSFARRRVARVEAANRLLEQRIAERTEALEQANAQLSAIAVIDPLTQVNNRRAFDLALGREWARCMQSGQPLAALMIDADHFKAFNDRFGHLEGDRALVGLASVLGQGLQPPREMLARYGGEEFVLLLPGVRPEQAMERAERLRCAVALSRVGVTVSIGVAVRVPAAGESSSRLIREADMALYAAKRAGRNRVQYAEA